MISNRSPYWLRAMREIEDDITPVVDSHISSEFLEASCDVPSFVGCARCGYAGDLFSPLHLSQCVRGGTTPLNGPARSVEPWWLSQDQNAAWINQWSEDHEDDKREEPRALLDELFGEDDER